MQRAGLSEFRALATRVGLRVREPEHLAHFLVGEGAGQLLEGDFLLAGLDGVETPIAPPDVSARARSACFARRTGGSARPGP